MTKSLILQGLVLVLSSSGVICTSPLFHPRRFIVGGENATQGEFPFQVSIRTYGLGNLGHMCGGAILSPRLVVTAAACTDPRSPPIDEVVAGSLKRTQSVPWQQSRTVNISIPHPGYNGTTMDNDLSLLFLNEDFQFNENISSISLPLPNIETYPKPVVLSGWGSVQYGEPMFEDLQKVTLDTFNDTDCEIWTGQDVRKELLCAGAVEGGRSACQGDAGSPLVVLGNSSYIAAVDSHFPCSGPCCGRPGPTEQTPELSFYIGWISEQNRIYGGGYELKFAN